MANREEMQANIFKKILEKHNTSHSNIRGKISENEVVNMRILYEKKDLNLFKENKFKILHAGDLYPKVSYKLIQYDEKIYVIFLGINELNFLDNQEELSVLKQEYESEKIDRVFLTNILNECIDHLSLHDPNNVSDMFDFLTGKDYKDKYNKLLKELSEEKLLKNLDLDLENFRKPEKFTENIGLVEEALGKPLPFSLKRNFLFEYDIKEIFSFLEKITIFRVEESIVFINDFRDYKNEREKKLDLNKEKLNLSLEKFIYKTLIYIFSQSKFESAFTLPFSAENKNKILNLISSKDISEKTTIYENLFNAILSVHWQNVYLCLYKEIEYNFPKYAFDEFKEAMTSKFSGFEKIDPFELAEILETSISSRPKEEQTIEKIIDILVKQSLEKKGLSYSDFSTFSSDEPSFLNGIYEIVKEEKHSAYEKTKDKDGKTVEIYNMKSKVTHTAKRMYKLRNKIVHSREALRKDKIKNNFSNEEWNQLIYNQLVILGKITKK